ncbi:MAG: diguanylate cyclase (GGDEF)-like protein [Clostridium sp.]|jgi:diguanylate cyclase (GGDEF)-like protein
MFKIEMKIILSIVFFTIFIVGLERYQLSENILEQFVESKKSKNELLINTIAPIVSLNLSLGLDNAYKDYLETIAQQNNDLEYIKLTDIKNNDIYVYTKGADFKISNENNNFHYSQKDIIDSLTEDKLATIILKFSNKEYEDMIKKNRNITINISIVTLILLAVFVLLIKRVFKHLEKLTNDILLYDPKKNNFTMSKSTSNDEIGLIHNAIISMVKKIHLHTSILDELNASLEDKVRKRTEELEQSNKELELQASIDPLTQLYNRRYFSKTSEHIIDIAKRNKTDISVIMLDIDKFKRVNDTYGHKVGDDVLISIATTLQHLIRKSDILCRFGGEEFLILLPETNLDGAAIIAEKMRLGIESNVIQINNVIEQKCTVSIGVAQVNSRLETQVETSIHRADQALYEAKEHGRNRVYLNNNGLIEIFTS